MGRYFIRSRKGDCSSPEKLIILFMYYKDAKLVPIPKVSDCDTEVIRSRIYSASSAAADVAAATV